jgi:hypothetical protein
MFFLDLFVLDWNFVLVYFHQVSMALNSVHEGLDTVLIFFSIIYLAVRITDFVYKNFKRIKKKP